MPRISKRGSECHTRKETNCPLPDGPDRPVELAHFQAHGCGTGFELKEADEKAARVSRNEGHRNAELLERAAR